MDELDDYHETLFHRTQERFFDSEDAIMAIIEPALMKRVKEILYIQVHGDDDSTDKENGIGDARSDEESLGAQA